MDQRASKQLLELHRGAVFADAEQATLMFLCETDRVLLMHKRRGHGAGLINAPGGKLEAGETPLACALRETREEVGLEVHDARLLGELRFLDISGERILGWAFRAERAAGEPVVTAEAEPMWFPLDAIPYSSMWPGDRFWLPWLLSGSAFRASLLCDGQQVLESRVSAMPRRWQNSC